MTPTPIPWPTPTFMPTSAATPAIQFGGDELVYGMAEDFVQGYHQARMFGALDMLFFALIFIIVLGGMWSIMRHVRNL